MHLVVHSVVFLFSISFIIISFFFLLFISCLAVGLFCFFVSFCRLTESDLIVRFCGDGGGGLRDRAISLVRPASPPSNRPIRMSETSSSDIDGPVGRGDRWSRRFHAIKGHSFPFGPYGNFFLFSFLPSSYFLFIFFFSVSIRFLILFY